MTEVATLWRRLRDENARKNKGNSSVGEKKGVKIKKRPINVM